MGERAAAFIAIRMAAAQLMARRDEVASLHRWMKAQHTTSQMLDLARYMDGRLEALTSEQAALNEQLTELEKAYG